MTLKQFKINAALIITLTIVGCLLVKRAKGEDVVPSSRAASYQQVFAIIGPPASQNGTLYPGTTMFMLWSYKKEVRETWHFGKLPTRTKLQGHSVNCFYEEEKYFDGSMAFKIIKSTDQK